MKKWIKKIWVIFWGVEDKIEITLKIIRVIQALKNCSTVSWFSVESELYPLENAENQKFSVLKAAKTLKIIADNDPYSFEVLIDALKEKPKPQLGGILHQLGATALANELALSKSQAGALLADQYAKFKKTA